MFHRCKAITKRGTACKARPTSSGFCPLHAHPSAAAELGSAGGKKNKRFQHADPDPSAVPPRTAEDVQQILAAAMVEVKQGRLDPKIGTTLGYLGSALLKSIEARDFEQRIEQLEKKIKSH